MNIVIWMLAGAILGWLGYSVLSFNEERGRLVSIVIGAIGGIVGGKVVAPVFTTVAATGEFSMPALLIAATVAATFLAIGNLVHNRWGV
jgi:uncharacterized membrane protein YeaQ/YmgE (transglycosylase-associated protein family)